MVTMQYSSTQCQTDTQLSVAAVQQSCLTTLSGLVSVPTAQTLPSSLTDSWSRTDVLAALVHTLRARDGILDVSQSQSIDLQGQGSTDETALLDQLHDLVDALAPTMHRHDAHLAQAIVALLSDLHQLPASFSVPPSSYPSSAAQSVTASTDSDTHLALTTLKTRLSSLHMNTPNGTSSSSHPVRLTPVQTVQTALLWSRIDEQLEAVVALCKARASADSHLHSSDNMDPFSDAAHISGEQTVRAPSFDAQHLLPPEYKYEYDVSHEDMPPAYPADLALAPPSHDRKTLLDSEYPPEKVVPAPSTSQAVPDAENTATLDLDLVTHAIDRLYAVAPQLTNQRVELRHEKIAQMQKATHNKGKSRATMIADDADLDKMFYLLGRANSREMADQKVAIDPSRKGRVKGKPNLEQQVSFRCVDFGLKSKTIR